MPKQPKKPKLAPLPNVPRPKSNLKELIRKLREQESAPPTGHRAIPGMPDPPAGSGYKKALDRLKHTEPPGMFAALRAKRKRRSGLA